MDECAHVHIYTLKHTQPSSQDTNKHYNHTPYISTTIKFYLERQTFPLTRKRTQGDLSVSNDNSATAPFFFF